MSNLTLFSRHGCHLCEVMQQELQTLLAEYGCELLIEDVDSRQDWQNSYGHLLPVLLTSGGEMLCKYHLDEKAVKDWLMAQAASLCPD